MSEASPLKLVKSREEDNKRRCENWLVTFGNFTAPRSESPNTILFWCGLFTLAAVVRRNVKISKKYLGSWECYPFIYTIFVGEQGLIKKSTTIGFAEELLDELDELNLSKCPEAVTVPDLVKRLEQADDSAVYMLLSEFSLLPLKAGFGIYDVLTKLFDGAKKIDEGTLGRGYVMSANPCLNLCAATTPKWVSANISEDILGGGFGSRVIFIHESNVRQRGLLWAHRVDHEEIEKLKQDLVHDLRIISKIQGEFELPGIEDPTDVTKPYGFFEQWYLKNAEAPPGVDSRLKGFYNRKPSYVAKVAMLIHLARSNDLVLTIDDFEQAVKIMDEIQTKVASTFANVGRNPYQADMKGIAAYVRDNETVLKSQVKSHFSYMAEPRKLEELIQGLIDAGEIEMEFSKDADDWILKYSG